MPSTLVTRNIVATGHRTSVRLEPGMWTALRDLCLREGLSIHEFCTLVDRHRHESGLTAGIRVALLSYFRNGELPGERLPFSRREKEGPAGRRPVGG